MKEPLGSTWWMYALRGAIALIFGLLAAAWPEITLLWLVVLFTVYALVGGAVSVYVGLTRRRENRHWWLVLLLGAVSLAAGVVSMLYPGLTALTLVLLMGANALLVGVLDITVAIRLRRMAQRQPLLILAGALSIIFGALVLLFPGAGALALVWLISLHAVFTGVLLLAYALRTRSLTDTPASRPHTFSPG